LLTAARTNWNLIWTNCKNIQYKVYKPFEKMPPLLSAFASVCFFYNNRLYYFLDV